MKATELMIGDYIMFDGSPYIIEEISAKGWIHILHINNKARVTLSSDYILDFIEGTPLTPEILEKNGFVIKKKWAQVGSFGDSPLIMWHFEDDPILRHFKHELEIHQNDTGKVHIHIPCEFVHELQHALKLCGISKEIIL